MRFFLFSIDTRESSPSHATTICLPNFLSSSSLYFSVVCVLLQTSGPFQTWQWPVTAPVSAPSLATLTPAGCLASLPPTVRSPRTPPISPPSCLTRKWTDRSTWWPTAARSPWWRRNVGRVVALVAAAPKWPAWGSWPHTAVPTLGAETHLAKTVASRRSHWARQRSTTLPPPPLARPPRERSTCEGQALNFKSPMIHDAAHRLTSHLLTATPCAYNSLCRSTTHPSSFLQLHHRTRL